MSDSDQNEKIEEIHINVNMVPHLNEWFKFDLPEINPPDNSAILTQLKEKFEITSIYQDMRSIK